MLLLHKGGAADRELFKVIASGNADVNGKRVSGSLGFGLNEFLCQAVAGGGGSYSGQHKIHLDFPYNLAFIEPERLDCAIQFFLFGRANQNSHILWFSAIFF